MKQPIKTIPLGASFRIYGELVKLKRYNRKSKIVTVTNKDGRDSHLSGNLIGEIEI